MTQWEYKCVFSGYNTRENTKPLEDLLNLHGSEGWEVVHLIDRSHSRLLLYDLILKRPKV